MKLLKITIIPATLVIALAMLLLFKSGVMTHASSPQVACNTWNVVPSPSPGTNNVLDEVSASSQV